MDIKIEKVEHHRNGVSGNSFNVVLFEFKEDGKTHRMIGIVFEENKSVAVLDRDLLAKDTIEFLKNSWRGDHFEESLREAIEQDD